MGLGIIRKPFKYTYRNASLIIIAVNVGVYLVTLLFPGLVYILGLNPVLFWGEGMFWQPFTYMFVHGGFFHVFFNMLGLLFFGIAAERAMGTREFTLMYLLCGFLSGLISLLVYTLSGMFHVLLIGASGAVYSILLAYAVIFPRSQIYVWGILPLPAPVLVVVYALLELGSQFTGAGAGVAHLTHLAGFAVAWIYFIVRMGVHPLKVWKDAYR